MYADPHMEAPHLEGEYHEIHSVVVDGGDRFAVSSVAFDGQEELLWNGNGGVSGFVKKCGLLLFHFINSLCRLLHR